jgi:hypothetical protein
LTGVKSFSENYADDEDDNNPLGIIHIAIFYATWLIVEIVHQIRLRKLRRIAENRSSFELKDNVRKVFTLDEFKGLIMKGKQLVILDDLVLDIKNYVLNHPGG